MNDNLNCLKSAQDEWYLIGFKDNSIVCLDGGHSTTEGVAKALKLHLAIWGDKKYEGVIWKAALFTDVPAIDIAINEEAAASCRKMVEAQNK